MRIVDYRRAAAVEYARKWAFSRNPAFFDFSAIGGDCTNFASQCLLAGAGIMNFTPTFGWYYLNANERTASWTGVEFFANFLLGNAQGIGDGVGPFAEETTLSRLEIGDFIQLGRETGDFYHTPIVVGFTQNGVPLVAAHTYDAFGRPLSTYSFAKLRCLHILGVRELE